MWQFHRKFSAIKNNETYIIIIIITGVYSNAVLLLP